MFFLGPGAEVYQSASFAAEGAEFILRLPEDFFAAGGAFNSSGHCGILYWEWVKGLACASPGLPSKVNYSAEDCSGGFGAVASLPLSPSRPKVITFSQERLLGV